MTDTAPPSAFEIAESKMACDLGLWPVVETLVVAALACCVETWALYLAAEKQVGWLDLGLIHLVVDCIVIAWAVWAKRRIDGIRTGVALAVAVVALGPVGSLGIMLMVVLLAMFRRQAKGFLEWYLSLFPEDERSVGRDLYDRLITGRARDDDSESVASFADFLDHGTPQQKQTILALLARNFRPVFAPALRGAMNDSDATVRVMAATAVARIENSFLEQSLRFRAACEEKPNDYATWLDSARLFDDYAFTGILDADREKENRIRAHEAYLRCAGIDPAQAAPIIALGRLALRSGKAEEASTWFERSIELAPGRVDLVVWLMEALFKRGDFSRVRSLSVGLGEDLDQVAGLIEEVKRSVRLWRGEMA